MSSLITLPVIPKWESLPDLTAPSERLDQMESTYHLRIDDILQVKGEWI